MTGRSRPPGKVMARIFKWLSDRSQHHASAAACRAAWYAFHRVLSREVCLLAGPESTGGRKTGYRGLRGPRHRAEGRLRREVAENFVDGESGYRDLAGCVGAPLAPRDARWNLPESPASLRGPPDRRLLFLPLALGGCRGVGGSALRRRHVLGPNRSPGLNLFSGCLISSYLEVRSVPCRFRVFGLWDGIPSLCVLAVRVGLCVTW